jgi:hypothetical protein
MDNQSDRPERRLEQSPKALEALRRAQADQIAQQRRQMEAHGGTERRGQAGSESRATRAPRADNVEHVERASSKTQRIEGRSPDEVAAIRASRPSEMRRDAAALWEPVHRRNYTEFSDRVAKGKLQKGEHLESKTVWADQIAPISVTAPEHHVESEEFWHHHDNGPDFYRRMGESYPKLAEQLKKGKSAKELANDPEFKEAAAFWYGNPPLKLEHYKDSYFCDESGHHRVALAHRYQLEGIPAQVREWNEKAE